MLFKQTMRHAIAAGAKDQTRRVVTVRNSLVHPGTFGGLDLSTGRARRQESPEIRARCLFESGRVRVVTVTSTVRAGDLFWMKAHRFTSRAKSEGDLEVLAVDVARVQDMTDEDALAEGVAYLPFSPKFGQMADRSPREWFAWLWDDINGKGAWERNDWVWIYRFRPITRATPGSPAYVQEEKADDR